MKLKDGFIVHTAGDEHMMVASGKAAKQFNGLVRGNETAAFILEMLIKETTEEAIVEAMLKEYDAPKEQIASDVAVFINKLRSEGFLDE